MPAQRPGRSKQDYSTPPEFIAAVEKQWGKLELDLAAREDNAKAQYYLTPEDDSLSCAWHQDYGSVVRMWLNPPYADIGPWAAKCAETRLVPGGRIFFLVPASIGSNWFAEHVHGRALVLALSPRLTFEGCTTPYPKDCILAVYGEGPGFDVWRWKP